MQTHIYVPTHRMVDPSTLPPGVVLLRGWLSVEQQIEVVRVLR